MGGLFNTFTNVVVYPYWAGGEPPPQHLGFSYEEGLRWASMYARSTDKGAPPQVPTKYERDQKCPPQRYLRI